MGEGVADSALEPQSFDRAMLVTVLGEIPNRERAMAEIFRALKPGGVLAVTEALPDPHYQPYSRVRRLASQVGFVPLNRYGNWVAFTANFIKPPHKLAPTPPVG
jgi:ubiquinone/menaquinone biosynthesis C-methylase UbiE